jgi:hypothetical protein
VQTDVTQRASAATRRTQSSTASSPSSSMWPGPPGMHSRSALATSSKLRSASSVSPLPLRTGPATFHTVSTRTPRTRVNTSCGPVRSSWVTPGNSSIAMRNGSPG